jgi:hypothetical protein
LTLAQLHDKLAASKVTVNKLRVHVRVFNSEEIMFRHLSQTLNLISPLDSARSHLATLTEVVQFLGSQPVPAQHRIFSNAAAEEWSGAKLLEQLRLAAAGKYTARNYTRYEIDLTILLYELGGAGAVHVMNHSIFVLPSLTTIQPYRRRRKLLPRIDRLRMSNIAHNISVLYGDQEPSETAGDASTSRSFERCAHTVSFDELAIERKID